MTQKKRKILRAALQLFGQYGYHSISTAQIASQAEVSEGLIFRHFGSKQGLLEYLYQEMGEKMTSIFQPILDSTDPKEVLRQSIVFPFKHLIGADENYWRLSFRLKWQEGFDASQLLQPWRERVIHAFAALGYAEPQLETQLLERTIDGIAAKILQHGINSQLPLRDFLLQKYKV